MVYKRCKKCLVLENKFEILLEFIKTMKMECQGCEHLPDCEATNPNECLQILIGEQLQKMDM